MAHNQALKLVSVVCCVVTLAAIATVLAAVYMSSDGDVTGNGIESRDSPSRRTRREAEEDADRRKVWLIAHGHGWGAYEYVGVDGYITGFVKPLLNAVCQAAGIKCVSVWDKYSNCLTSNPGQHLFAGPGLMGRWYDACSAWSQTVGRMHIFSFSKSFIKQHGSYFFTKPGNNWLNTANIDLTGKKLVFIDGWVNDEKCLARQSGIRGNVLATTQLVHVQTAEEFFQMIDSGQVDGGFSGIETFEEQYVKMGKLQRNGGPYYCAIGGNGCMTRKDSRFIRYFNEGLDKIMSDGTFRKICEEAKQKHIQNGPVDCVDT